ncbi:MAG TPA: DUF3800 domain-containing protein [Thermoanaerobaculia bacterium]|nr:DUF3800 domain-containing protein [Thermoanaerobaculia bacterium]
MILKGYYDGSGNEEDRFLSLAGFVASIEVWERFERCWLETLQAAPHPCPHFHTYDAHQRIKVFDGWTQQEVRSLLHSLLNNCVFPATIEPLADIYSAPFFGVYCSIDKEEFERACVEIPSLRAKGRAAVCAEFITDTALKRLPQKGGLQLYFDSNEKFKGKIETEWNKAKKKPAGKRGPLEMISQITSADMKTTPGIQAADILAWHVNRWQTNNDDWGANMLAVFCAGRGVRFDCEKLKRWYGYNK